MKIFATIQKSILKIDRPQEDYLSGSGKFPIFCVADGVTLQPDNAKDYPNPSGAGIAAKIFCEIAVLEAEKLYENFNDKDLLGIFIKANKALADYNASQGRTLETINYWDFDLFSVTGAFVLVKDNKAFWWSICDSGAVFMDKSGKLILKSPVYDSSNTDFLPKDWAEMEHQKRSVIMHKFRNRVGEDGELLGYGVADGEESAVKYLNIATLDLKKGDVAMIYTDGFENYFAREDFRNAFLKWGSNLENELTDIMEKAISENKEKYGLEKTIVAISF